MKVSILPLVLLFLFCFCSIVLSRQAQYVVRMRGGEEAVFPNAAISNADRRAVKSVHFSNYSFFKEVNFLVALFRRVLVSFTVLAVVICSFCL